MRPDSVCAEHAPQQSGASFWEQKMRALSTAMPVALDPKSVAIASGVNREAGGVNREAGGRRKRTLR